MQFQAEVYEKLPERVKPAIRRAYVRLFDRHIEGGDHNSFIGVIFKSNKQYEKYAEEFESGSVNQLWNAAIQDYQRLTPKDDSSGIDRGTAKDLYALVRELNPTTVIETGVCNGVSTTAILLALNKNESGNLHSIDYPLKTDEPLDEFREETFEEYGGAAIPRDKESGWIIPERLKSRWDLTIGKSQRILPQLITESPPDIFIHDSEHSQPCMMFEYELAYEWLGENGVILSDDILSNESFSTFTDVRGPVWGELRSDVGYMIKGDV